MNNPDQNSYLTVMSQGPKEVYFPLDTIMDKMPNVKRWAEKYPEFYKGLTANDGHIYAIPKINDFSFFDWGFLVRADLLEGEAMTAENIETTAFDHSMLNSTVKHSIVNFIII